MHWFDELFHAVIGVCVLAIILHVFYAEAALLSVVEAVCALAFFSIGRFGVRAIRRRRDRESGSAYDENE